MSYFNSMKNNVLVRFCVLERAEDVSPRISFLAFEVCFTVFGKVSPFKAVIYLAGLSEIN